MSSDQIADTVVMDCVCGHVESDHFRGTGNCMFSTEAETWACDCHEYRPDHSDGSLLCQNCGKPMADHDDMAHCWVRALPDQYDG